VEDQCGLDRSPMRFLTPEKMHRIGQHPINVPAGAWVIDADLVLNVTR
jgi:hypothetical protein